MLNSVLDHNIPQRLCVFDFDDTLGVAEAYPGVLPEEIFGGNQRISQLSMLFTELTDAGIVLAVCSYNEARTLAPIMEAAGFDVFFSGGVYGWESVCDAWSPRKSEVIRSTILPALARTHPAAAWDILFVDDNPFNVQDVSRAPLALHHEQSSPSCACCMAGSSTPRVLHNTMPNRRHAGPGAHGRPSMGVGATGSAPRQSHQQDAPRRPKLDSV